MHDTVSKPFNWRGIAWSLLSTLNFALMGVLIKACYQHFSFHSNELIFWRTMPAVIFLSVTAVIRRQNLRTRYLSKHLSRSLSGTISMMLFFYAVAQLPLATATTLSYTSSLSLALLSFIFLGEHIARLTIFALLLGCAGVAVLLRPAFADGSSIGIVAALGSSLLAGWAYLQLRQMTEINEPAWRIVFYFSLISMIGAALGATLQGWHLPPLSTLPYLAGIAGSALIAQFALTRAYAAGPKFTVAAMSYLTVAFSALLSAQFFGETLNAPKIIGMIIIVFAGILTAYSGRKS